MIRTGSELKEQRRSLGLNLESVARALSVSIQTISEIERLPDESDRYQDRRGELAEFLDRLRLARGIAIPVEGVASPGQPVASRVASAVFDNPSVVYRDELDIGIADWWMMSDPDADPSWFGVRLCVDIRDARRDDLMFFTPANAAPLGAIVLVGRRLTEAAEPEIGLGLVHRVDGMSDAPDWIAMVVPQIQIVPINGEWSILARDVGFWRTRAIASE